MWREITSHLDARRKLLDEEIRDYPRPIPRWDAQFNHLYDQRARILRELEQEQARAERDLTRNDYLELIEAFIEAPGDIGDEAERTIRARLRARLSRIQSRR